MRLALVSSLLAASGCVYTHRHIHEEVRSEVIVEHVPPEVIGDLGARSRVTLHLADAPALALRDVVVRRAGDELVVTEQGGLGRVMRVPLADVLAVDAEAAHAERSLAVERSTHVEPLLVGVAVSALLTAIALGVALSKSFDDAWDDVEWEGSL